MRKLLIVLMLALNSVIYSQGFICAVGGGSEDYNDWSDMPYSWIVEKGNYGKVVVLSYSDQTEWIPNYFVSFGAASAENIKINSRTIADLQETYDSIASAQAVFIKGGDQWRYVSYWKGTKTEDAIREVFLNGGVVAGTSAGAMILSDVVFSAQYNSAYSHKSLLNPFYTDITLEDNFLDLAANTIFDTHFIERGRFGRLIAFIFNAFHSLEKDLLGIGIDDRTALCINPDGTSVVYGSGAVSFFHKDLQTLYSGNNSNYTIENLRCDQLLHGWEYDIANRIILNIPDNTNDFNSMNNADLPHTNIWLSGSNYINSNINNGLNDFLNNINTADVIIIYNSGYVTEKDSILNYLSTNSITFSEVEISDVSINIQSNADIVLGGTGFIIAGNNLSSLGLISNNTSLVGAAFNAKKINTPMYFVGNAGKLSGDNYVDNVDNYKYSGYYGNMTNNAGLSIYEDFIFQPLIWDDSDYYENRTSALLWGLAINHKRIGIYLNGSDYLTISSNSPVIEIFGDYPIIVVDTRLSSKVGFSDYIAGGNNTRQVIGIDNLRYTISSISKKYDIDINNQNDIYSILPKKFSLFQNYPNPFNNTTIIPYTLAEDGNVKILLYDILGGHVGTLVDEYKPAGNYNYYLDFGELNGIRVSGVYYYSLIVDGQADTRKMIYLK